MLGVVDEPGPHARRRRDAAGRRARWAWATRSTRRPSACSSAARARRRRRGRRPVLRRRGPRPQPVPQVRRVHDRLPPQRQEHPGQELPLPRREERRRGAAADHGHPGPRRATGGGYDVARAAHQGQAGDARRPPRTLTADQVVLAAVGARHPAAAAPDEGRGPPARLSDRLGHLTRTNSESILGRHRARHRGRLQPRASRSRRPSTPTSTPTSSRCATARAAT